VPVPSLVGGGCTGRVAPPSPDSESPPVGSVELSGVVVLSLGTVELVTGRVLFPLV